MYKDKPSIEELISSIDISDEFLEHVGVDHTESNPGSGRYRYGSGENPYQHYIDFLTRVEQLKAENPTFYDAEGKFGPVGKTYTGDTAIAHMLGLSTKQYRTQISLANSEKRTNDYIRAKALHDSGHGYSDIARRLGLPGESSVRSLLNTETQHRKEMAKNTAEFLKEQIEEKGMIDVGTGVENYLGISREKLDSALYILEQEGYTIQKGRIQNVTDPSGMHQTTLWIAGPKDIPKDAIYKYENINFLNTDEYNKFRQENGIDILEDYTSRDNGDTFEKKFVYPESMDSSRLYVRYAEDGGLSKDGVIEIRPGVKDLSLGDSTYAQVRVLVDDKKYLKGMALYSNDIPEGYDVVFNTNKSDTGNKLDALKDVSKNLAKDPENPFGSNIKETGQNYYIDIDGSRKLGLINKTREEGDWSEWKDKVPAQFLSKQPLKLAERQLNLAIEEKQKEYDDICALENDTLKKYFLDEFASDCNSASVHLQAAALPRQKHQVILPVDSMKDNEVYAPNFENGEKVALVRYPHGGTFEIPILTVNNKQPEALALLKGNTKDCVAINSKIASRLSGADFDGDTVMVIPTNDKVQILSTPELPGLKGFDPKTDYKPSKIIFASESKDGQDHYFNKYGQEYKIMSNTDTQMGVISNLITDMTLKGANREELARAVRHSMVVIDAEKHKLDYKTSEKENKIDELKALYQAKVNDETGRVSYGASTLISKAKSDMPKDKTQGTPKPNIKGKPWYDETKPEGSLIFKTSDQLYYVEVKDPITGKWVNAYDQTNKSDKEAAKNNDISAVRDKIKEGKFKYTVRDENGNKQAIDISDKEYRIKKRTQSSTKMEETDDARTLISKENTRMEQLYANYANTMKSFANRARKESFETKDMHRDPVAAKTYDKEVRSLKQKLDISEKNPPRERQAQVIATSRVRIKKETANPPLTKGELKKLNDRELKKARQEVGASRHSIDISDKEWEAIQAGAISASLMKRILKYADKDKLRERATPRPKTELSTAQVSRIHSMAASGKTNAEIAKALGISATSVGNYLKMDQNGESKEV